MLVAPLMSFAQGTWRNGTIILKDGSTIEGQINDLEWNNAPKSIEFRRFGGSVENYNADHLISFSSDRPALYESHLVRYDADTENLKYLPGGKESSNLATEKLFLEVIVNAPIALLFMQDKNFRQHFFIKRDTTVVELLNRNYQNPDGIALLTNQKYKQQIAVITNDCPDVQSSIKLLRYTRASLSAIFAKINQCKGNAVTMGSNGVEQTRKPLNVGIAVQGFIMANSYPGYYYSRFGDLNFGGGLFMELYSKKRPNRISLYNELLYKRINAQHGRLNRSPNVVTDFQCEKLRLSNAIRLSYPHKSKGRFYFGFGTIIGYRMNTLINGNSAVNKIGEKFGSGFEVGITGMIGETIVIGKSFKVNTEFRYEYEFQNSNSFNFNNLGLGLQFYLK
jgi:hypothetical protein